MGFFSFFLLAIADQKLFKVTGGTGGNLKMQINHKSQTKSNVFSLLKDRISLTVVYTLKLQCISPGCCTHIDICVSALRLVTCAARHYYSTHMITPLPTPHRTYRRFHFAAFLCQLLIKSRSGEACQGRHRWTQMKTAGAGTQLTTHPQLHAGLIQHRNDALSA